MFVRNVPLGNHHEVLNVRLMFIMWKFQSGEVYTPRFVEESRCLNFTQIDEPREDNKEHKVYSLKLLAKRNTPARRFESCKTKPAARRGGGGAQHLTAAIPLSN